MADRVGQQFGNYRLVRLLGYGGFAEVYLGEHVHLQTQAAIKVLLTQLITDDLERFKREARTIASLEHPHIVRILDFGIEDNVPFLVMNYAPNGTLRQRHPKESKVALADVLTYVQPMASALQYAHDRKLIHRDVKPENMLLGNQNNVLLSDFGIAVSTSTSTSRQTKTTAGTAAYMAPEQIMSKPDVASDQYALGMIVYEWLSGDQPFNGSFFEMCAQHLHAPIPSLREKNPEIPVGIEQCVLKALEKYPAQRFARIQDFATALQENYPLVSQTNVVTLESSLVLSYSTNAGSNEATWLKKPDGDRSTSINSPANNATFLSGNPPHPAGPGAMGSDTLTFGKDSVYLSQSTGTFPDSMGQMANMPTAILQGQSDLQAVGAASTQGFTPSPVPLSSPMPPRPYATNSTNKKNAELGIILAVTLPILVLALVSLPFFIIWFSGLASTSAHQSAPPKQGTSTMYYSTAHSATAAQQPAGGTPMQQPTDTPTRQPTSTPTPSSGQVSPGSPVPAQRLTPTATPTPTPTSIPVVTPTLMATP